MLINVTFFHYDKKSDKSLAFGTMGCYNEGTKCRKEIEMEERKRKKKTGRPCISDETKNLVVRLYNEDEMSCAEIAKACNISTRSVFRIMNERTEKANVTKEE